MNEKMLKVGHSYRAENFNKVNELLDKFPGLNSITTFEAGFISGALYYETLPQLLHFVNECGMHFIYLAFSTEIKGLEVGEKTG